jgi:hypothetical protein
MGHLPYSNNKEDLVISDYGLHTGGALDRERGKDKVNGANQNGMQGQNAGVDNAREGYPKMINLNTQN